MEGDIFARLEREPDMVVRSEVLAEYLHRGQFRKSGNLPYVTHPFAVRDILVSFGHDDPEIQATSVLHDTVEDTDVMGDKRNIKHLFGGNVYSGVYILSNNTVGKYSDEYQTMFENLGIPYMDSDGKLTEEAYKARLLFAKDWVKMIKLGDMIHNTSTLPALSKWGIERKINDAKNFYIPLGKYIEPRMTERLEDNIAKYMKSEHYKRTFEL